MNRRIFLLAAVLGMLSFAAAPAVADDDGGSGKSGEDDHDNSGSGSDGSGDDHDDGTDDGGGGGKSGSSSNDSDIEDDDKAARLAVAAKDAVPLTVILGKFRALGSFTVIDVKLSRSNRTLLYIVKYIDGEGRVARTFFDARTGELVK